MREKEITSHSWDTPPHDCKTQGWSRPKLEPEIQAIQSIQSHMHGRDTSRDYPAVPRVRVNGKLDQKWSQGSHPGTLQWVMGVTVGIFKTVPDAHPYNAISDW